MEPDPEYFISIERLPGLLEPGVSNVHLIGTSADKIQCCPWRRILEF